MADDELITELYQAKLSDTGHQAIENDYMKFVKQITHGLEFGELDLTNVQGSYNVFSRVSRFIRQYSKIYSLKFFANLNKDIGMQRILQILKTNPKIKVIDIGCNDLSDESASLLTDIITMTNVRSLQLGKKGRSLSMNRFTRDGVTQMLETLAMKNSLVCLGISGIGSIKQKKTHNFIEYSSLLGKVIANCPRISTLDISECGLCATDLDPLVEGFNKNKTLRHVSISDNPFVNCADLVGAITSNKRLRYLDISNAGVTGEGVDQLCKSIEDELQLIYLNISNNPVGPNGISDLFETLQNNIYLTSLSVSGTGADETIGAQLVHFLTNNTVIHDLDLSKNNVCDDIAEILGQTMDKQVSLKELNISSCRISDKGAISLAKALRSNTELKRLYLRDNFLTRNAGFILVDILKENHTITVLDLASNQIDIFSNEIIKTFCQRNKNNQVDDTLSVLRKKHINLSIDNAKIPVIEEKLAALRSEKKRLLDEINEIQAEINREHEIKNVNTKDFEKTHEEMQQFINDDKKVINDTENAIEELKEQRKIDALEFENKCKLADQEFERLENVAAKYVKQTEQARKQGEVDKAKYSEDIKNIEALIKEVKAAIKNRAGMLDYVIPENPYIEKEAPKNANEEHLKPKHDESDEYFAKLQEQNRMDEEMNENKNKKRKKRRKSKYPKDSKNEGDQDKEGEPDQETK